MDSALHYLEKAFVEETATRLRSEGYSVESLEGVSDIGLDLVASKGDRKIAIRVKARPSLKFLAGDIGRSRDAARAQGFDEFRLVVVNPPHDREVSIEGLEGEIKRWIVANPGNMAEIGLGVNVLDFVGTDLTSVGVTKDGLRVVGVGAVLVEFTDDRQEDHTWTTDFPVSFDITLSHKLAIQAVEKLEIDLSSLED
jgi:hypothetical protein